MLGASHGLEIPFVFGHFDLGKSGNVIFDEAGRDAREALAARMMSYWARFAATGDPGAGREGSLPHWSAWGPGAGEPKFMIFDTRAGGGIRMSTDVVTASEVLALAQQDPALAARHDRGDILRAITETTRVP